MDFSIFIAYLMVLGHYAGHYQAKKAGTDPGGGRYKDFRCQIFI